MRDYIFSIFFVLTSIVISYICYRFRVWGIYEICFIVLGLFFTIVLRKQAKKYNIIFICIIIFIKPFIVLSEDLYDPMTLLMGVPVDMLLTGIGFLIGFMIAKLFLYIFSKDKNKNITRK